MENCRINLTTLISCTDFEILVASLFAYNDRLAVFRLNVLVLQSVCMIACVCWGGGGGADMLH